MRCLIGSRRACVTTSSRSTESSSPSMSSAFSLLGTVMARRVFFSFKYEDVARAMVVRNSWVTQGREAAGFIDAAEFEELKEEGNNAIQAWIDDQLDGTSVTV